MTEGDDSLRPPLGPLKEKAEEALIEAYARDEIDDRELERRLDHVNRSASLEELRRLLSDLPSAGGSLPALRPGDRSAAGAPVAGSSPLAPLSERTWSVAPAEQVRPRQFLLGFFGAATRKGPWTPARQVLATAVMGGVELDFREAVLPPGVTTITILAVMGGVEITVPPGVGVQCGGSGIMGGFDGVDQLPDKPGGPVLRIDGLALMGGVVVKVSDKLPKRLRSGRGEKQ